MQAHNFINKYNSSNKSTGFSTYDRVQATEKWLEYAIDIIDILLIILNLLSIKLLWDRSILSLDKFFNFSWGFGEWWDTSSAISLNGEVVRVHFNSEESLFSPVSSPWVSTNPIFSVGWFFESPSDDGDFVIDHGPHGFLGVDTTGVLFEFIGNHKTAGDGSVFEDLSLHLVGTWKTVVVWNIVLLVVNSPAVSLSVITFSGRGTSAIFTDINGTTGGLVQVFGSVLLAWGIRNTSLESIFVNTWWSSTIAWTTSFTVDDSLGVKIDGSWVVIFQKNVESISKRWGGSLSPAWSTIDGDMLVLWPGKEVSVVHVSPVPVGGKSGSINMFPWHWDRFNHTVFESSLWNSLATVLGFQEGFSIFLTMGIRTILSVFLVSNIVFLSLSGLVSGSVWPGINWSSPCAIGFNSNVVNTSDDSNESRFTIVGAPWVSNSPILGTVLNSESNDWNIVDNVLIASSVLIDTTSVFFKRIWDSYTTSNRSTLVDFLHHGLFSRNFAEFLDFVGVVFIWNKAVWAWLTVLANINGSTFNTIVMTSSLIDRTGLISNFIFVHKFERRDSFTTVATIIIHRAWNDNLRGDVDIGPLSFSGNLYSVRYGWGGSLSPAWTAILGNMLVFQICEVIDIVNIVPNPVVWKSSLN